MLETTVHHPISMIHPFITQERKDELASLTGKKFAVIQLSGTQFKVTVDDVIVTNKIGDYDIAENVEVKDVLLIGSQDMTVIGRPYVLGASVVLEVEEQTKDAKVIIFKKKRRKNYQRKTGFRRCVTMLRVKEINHNN